MCIRDRYHTEYSNIYLINGVKKSLLIDTGSGILPLRPIIEELIGKRSLIVVNTHAHFDHVGSNHEFDEVYIHESEVNKINRSMDISFLKDSPKNIVSLYEDNSFILKPAKKVNVLRDGDIFDLGDIQVNILHCPGHSEGSISLYTNRGELFTGDNAHYGAMYLPKIKKLSHFIRMVYTLVNLCKKENISQIFPSHEDNDLHKEFLVELINSLNKIDSNWNAKKFDRFNNCWKVDIENFMFMIKKEQ